MLVKIKMINGFPGKIQNHYNLLLSMKQRFLPFVKIMCENSLG